MDPLPHLVKSCKPNAATSIEVARDAWRASKELNLTASELLSKIPEDAAVEVRRVARELLTELGPDGSGVGTLFFTLPIEESPDFLSRRFLEDVLGSSV